MPCLLWIARVAELPLPASSIRTAAYLARHSDEIGELQADAKGRPPYSASSIAEALEIGESTAFKALVALQDAELIEWEKPSKLDRFHGAAGKVRLRLNAGNA